MSPRGGERRGAPTRPLPVGGREGAWTLGGIGAAFGLWYLIFVWPHGLFWLKIAVGSLALAALTLAACGRALRDLLVPRIDQVLLGAASSVVLWGVFWAGGKLLVALFAGSGAAIHSVYAPRRDASLWAIGLLRGLVQRSAVRRFGAMPGLLLASLVYSLVHAWTRNLPLMLAAFAAGLFWGGLFAWRRSLVAPIVSHSVWGVLVFVLLPLG
jgi:membrane protease YdiL (CAAX protease family)